MYIVVKIVLEYYEPIVDYVEIVYSGSSKSIAEKIVECENTANRHHIHHQLLEIF